MSWNEWHESSLTICNNSDLLRFANLLSGGAESQSGRSLDNEKTPAGGI